jgi:hypothetical protein
MRIATEILLTNEEHAELTTLVRPGALGRSKA